MTTRQTKVTYNYHELKYKFMESIVKIFIESDVEVIIFGGWCRDKLLHDAAAKKFFDNKMESNKYDDPEYDPSTKDRLLVAHDLDVFVRGNEETVKKFLSLFINKGVMIDKKKANVVYFVDFNIDRQKYVFKAGSPLTPMPKIKVNVDILYSTKEVEPPFHKLDMKCNAFLYDEDGFRLSHQTGTELDELSLTNHKLAESQIIQDIMNRNTEAIMPKIGASSNILQVHFNRCVKMVERGWKIDGKNYTIENLDKDVDCAICNEKGQNCMIICKHCMSKVHTPCFYVKILNWGTGPSCYKCGKGF